MCLSFGINKQKKIIFYCGTTNRTSFSGQVELALPVGITIYLNYVKTNGMRYYKTSYPASAKLNRC